MTFASLGLFTFTVSGSDDEHTIEVVLSEGCPDGMTLINKCTPVRGAASACSAYATNTTCPSSTCSWLPIESCYGTNPNCTHHQAQSSCAITGDCLWGVYGSCLPKCDLNTNMEDCASAAGCSWMKCATRLCAAFSTPVTPDVCGVSKFNCNSRVYTSGCVMKQVAGSMTCVKELWRTDGIPTFPANDKCAASIQSSIEACLSDEYCANDLAIKTVAMPSTWQCPSSYLDMADVDSGSGSFASTLTNYCTCRRTCNPQIVCPLLYQSCQATLICPAFHVCMQSCNHFDGENIYRVSNRIHKHPHHVGSHSLSPNQS
jgi:hypothetical protein